MWKVLFFLACAVSFIVVTSCDDKKCGTNERYVACPDTMCIPRNCSQRGFPVPCPVLGPEGRCPGKPACICVENYLRDDTTGECIPSKKCNPPATTAAPTTEPTKSPSCGCGVHPPKCGKNEVYNNCSDTGCRPQLCSQLGFPLNCDKKCKPGCICKNGYVRDDNGVCIPINNCPSCGGDKNAQSGCGNNCGKTCATYKMKPAICSLACKLNGCDCRDGFVYDPNVKSCVRPQDCTPTCKVNEEYSSCINGGCGPKNCTQIGQPNICIDPVICIKGCVCVKGYLRASNGTCVPKDKCPQLPPKCGKNEVYKNCSDTGCRPYLCSELGFPLNCDKKCKPGCICKDGYIRDDKGVCIPINNCPSCGGDKNAQSGCGNNCGKTCATYKMKPAICPLGCKLNGCDCRDGFVYDPNVKSCVRPQDCTPTCKVNEEYSSCINGGCGPKNCTQIGQPNICIDPVICIKGCVCVNGYLRASNGTCVPKDKCPQLPPKCGKNEVYNNCSYTGCRPYLCSELGFPLNCDKKCKPGCICKDGYVRDDKGVCIPINNCPSCGGDKNAQSGCGNNCGKTCATYKMKPAICPLGCKLNGCDCRDGFVYDPYVKSCVRPQDCTPTCKVNEEYSSCINGGCGPKNCTQIGQPNICIDPVICIKGCVCVNGYLRASNGTCVPKDKCPQLPPKCGKNEVYNNCSDTGCRPYLCSELGFPLNCDKKCKPGCICKDGYVRDDKGVCIPINNCPSCGGDKNAQSGCGNNCGKTCATYKMKPAICPLGCKLNGCDCRDGFVYDPNVKSCVRPKDCTPTCKVNEEYSSCINGGCGPKNCTQIGQPNICIDHVICIKGCVCVKGYLRASNGTCVPKDKCPQLPPKCVKNEVYNNCSDTSCRPYLCSELGFPLNCDKKCKPGCICKDGYVRDDKGVCIPINNCPSCGGDKNAQSGCGNNCGKTCATYKMKPAICPLGCKLNGCDCRDGFVYDPNVKSCVRPKDCTPTCKVNEEYSSCINGGCGPKNCTQIGQPNICIDPVICIKGCVCVKGYLRASNGTCVPKDKCPQLPPKCGKNEVYKNCSCTGCRPYLCSELGFPLNCDKKCKPGCICKDGYVRDDKGVCIPINNCPSCGGDKNAQSGCGNNCGKTCATYKMKPAFCTLACKLNGCDCRDGFVYDPNVKSCVRPQDCTPTCKVNEEYSSCINGGCGLKNCSQVGQQNICVDLVTCIKGCVCVKGYMRASNGACVPTSQCPAPDCPLGEVWSTCPTVKCDGDNCAKTRDSPQTCPGGIVCDKPRCVCGYNRKRDRKTGKCILITDCSPFKCNCNEEYQACPSSCLGENCSDYINKTKCPPYRIGIIVNCRPACKCIKGYYRNADGKCIPASECLADSTGDADAKQCCGLGQNN